MNRRTGSRASGTNPRAMGTNPRAMGTNPSAGTPADVRRAARERNRAMRILHASGRTWCPTCDDIGRIEQPDGWAPCPAHLTITTREAHAITYS